jgi:hypothetical protein
MGDLHGQKSSSLIRMKSPRAPDELARRQSG